MRLALDPRARRLLRRVPRTTVYTALELLLLSLLALQAARLAWALVTPVGPVGEWRSGAARPAASTGLLGSFDPFFRLSGGAPAVVTALNLKLFGVSENRATGRGSAIIEADGVQRSFAVGDEIMPGVTLAAVTFDSVTINRGGAMEQLFLDQSPPAAVVATGVVPPGAGAAMVTPPPQMPVIMPAPPPNLVSQVQFQPRLSQDRVTGVTVNPQGSGEAFRAAGLQPGDVILSVNGATIVSTEQAQMIAERFTGSEVTLVVERGGEPVTLRARTGQ